MVTENVEENEMGKVDLVGAFALTAVIFKDRDVGPCDMDRIAQVINMVLATLAERERAILEFRYGIRNGQFQSLTVVGKKFNVTRERIRQIEANAIRKLRHPSRSRILLSGFLLGWMREVQASMNEVKKSANELVEEVEKTIAEKKKKELEGSLLLQRLNELGDTQGMLITDLDLPLYVLRALRRGGFKYAFELLDEERISSLRGIGNVACRKIQCQLKEHNLIQKAD